MYHQHIGVPLRGGLGHEDLADQSTPRSRFDQIGTFDQEKSAPATDDLPVQFDRGDNPGRSFGEHRVRLRSDVRLLLGPFRPASSPDLFGRARFRQPRRTAR